VIIKEARLGLGFISFYSSNDEFLNQGAIGGRSLFVHSHTPGRGIASHFTPSAPIKNQVSGLNLCGKTLDLGCHWSLVICGNSVSGPPSTVKGVAFWAD
jgi:hypothetical protein